MTHYEKCQDSCRRHLNMILRRKVYNPLAIMETLVEAPAFHRQWRRELIQDAYAVHHLPDPYA